MPEMALSPRQAMLLPSRPAPLEQAAGEVCAEQVIPYPPGIPLLMPGETISAELIEYVEYLKRQQIKLVGPEDLQLNTVRVLAQ